MEETLLRDYARSILLNGAVMQPGQKVIVSAPCRAYAFVGLLAEEAYRLGAKDVCVFWGDSGLSRAKLLYADESSLDIGPEEDARRKLALAEEGACSVSLSSPDPDGMNGVDPARIMRQNMADMKAFRPFSQMTNSNRTRWTVAAVANEAWARKCFPMEDPAAATEHLWREILAIARADGEDAVTAWQAHIAAVKGNMDKLNALDIDKLHFQSQNGTDLTVFVNDGGHFIAGTCTQADGTLFCPNIPTEEVLISPHRLKTEGTVFNALPLVYAGHTVDGFRLTFREGKVVDWSCETGKEILEKILTADEGSSYLGECALVPCDSPIRKTGHLFYNTLFDENAACHLALGRGYPDTVGGEDRSTESLRAHGMNTSVLHVDFMFGTEDMRCTATLKDGREVMVMDNGLIVV